MDTQPLEYVRASQRVIMSIDAFLQTHRAMSGLLEHPEKPGAVARREEPAPGNGAAGDDANAGETGGGSAPRSPNSQ
uniref:Uncharacterized protein n=1 Tax=Candidatus Kentrum sp. SD TaxID=2126332 RepID=A0A451BIJ5_9GAMM|nr:MAG: hypothetical protein BECKSD772F_GA0070984_10084 [Candidatus Kentron sp. SD]VFK42049.1 MAG: hypothetical protein BECKSD772E_GA0070983_101327 [Candidatus Kentron sp. SD]VFK78097.1 MAG: hypothetical protein BECKSD772D_GA0070982_10074 [Candidatus Kentron sp. SD]